MMIDRYKLDVKLTKERKELINGGWEFKRIQSMLANTGNSDIIFDIGSEQGDISAILAAGGAGVVLFEPSPVMWPHIRANFKRNSLNPIDTYCGLVSNKTGEDVVTDYDDTQREGWPECAFGKVEHIRGFRHLYEHAEVTKQITIDDYVEKTKVIPTVLNIDVEGAELAVLEGMGKTVDTYMPLIYVSVHDELMRELYKKWPHQVFKKFREWNYKLEILDFDHELHVLAYKKSIKTIQEVV